MDSILIASVQIVQKLGKVIILAFLMNNLDHFLGKPFTVNKHDWIPVFYYFLLYSF